MVIQQLLRWVSTQQSQNQQVEPETNRQSESKYRRGAMVIGGLVGILIMNFFALSFMAGFTIGFASTQAGVLAMMGAYIFMAPFNYVLFNRLMDWV